MYENFTKQGIQYINIIRDPMSWFQSNYYFGLHGWIKKSDIPLSLGPQNYMDMKSLDETLDQCVLFKRKFCTITPSAFMEYFSGSFNKKYNLESFLSNGRSNQLSENLESRIFERAKNVILNDYVAIGILEELNKSLKLFEKLKPQFFNGSVVLAQNLIHLAVKTATRNSTPPSNATVEHLKKTILRYPYDLYNFVYSRFESQIQNLK